MRLLAFLLLVLLLPRAEAQSGACVVNDILYTNFRGQLTVMHPRVNGAQYCARAAVAAGANVAVSSQVPAVVSQVPATMTATRTIPLAAVARGAARALPVIGTGIVLVDIANSIRCRGTNQSVLYGAGLECDPGQPFVPTEGQVWSCNGEALSSIHDVPANYCDAPTALANCTARLVVTNPTLHCAWDTAHSPNTGRVTYQTSTSNYSGTDAIISSGVRTRDVCPFPSSTLGGVPFCPNGTYTPYTEQQAADRIAASPQFSANPGAVAEEAMERGHDFEPDASPTNLSGPATVSGTPTTTTTTTGGGAPQTRTSTPTQNITYAGDSFTWNTTTVTVEGDTTTVTNQGAGVEVCGLPGGPACRIDETGTPTTAQMAAAQAALDAAAAQLRDKVTEQSTPRPLPWLWGGISLPAGSCSNLVAPSPHESIPDGEIDVCGQPWVPWWRAAWAVFCGIWCAAYCWRRFSDTVEGSAA